MRIKWFNKLTNNPKICYFFEIYQLVFDVSVVFRWDVILFNCKTQIIKFIIPPSHETGVVNTTVP